MGAEWGPQGAERGPQGAEWGPQGAEWGPQGAERRPQSATLDYCELFKGGIKEVRFILIVKYKLIHLCNILDKHLCVSLTNGLLHGCQPYILHPRIYRRDSGTVHCW
jgi:hypothetical protein